MGSESINVIIGIMGLLLAVWPLLQTESKYFRYPFCEYDTAHSDVYAKRTGILWKANCVASFVLVFIAYYYQIKIDLGIVQKHPTYGSFVIYLILTASVIVKDIFHNLCAYKKWAEKVFKTAFDSIESLNIIVLLELIAILIITLSYFGFHIENDKVLLVALITLEIFFNLYRMLEEMCELIHVHKVNWLSIKMNDGTVYEKIKSYEEMKSCIRIMNKSNTIVYLSKDAICSITKEIEKARLIDTIRNAIKENKAKKAERK